MAVSLTEQWWQVIFTPLFSRHSCPELRAQLQSWSLGAVSLRSRRSSAESFPCHLWRPKAKRGEGVAGKLVETGGRGSPVLEIRFLIPELVGILQAGFPRSLWIRMEGTGFQLGFCYLAEGTVQWGIAVNVWWTGSCTNGYMRWALAFVIFSYWLLKSQFPHL